MSVNANKTVADKLRPRIDAEDDLHDLKAVRRHLRSAVALTELQKKVPRAVLERMQANLDDVNLLVDMANDRIIKLTED